MLTRSSMPESAMRSSRRMVELRVLARRMRFRISWVCHTSLRKTSRSAWACPSFVELHLDLVGDGQDPRISPTRPSRTACPRVDVRRPSVSGGDVRGPWVIRGARPWRTGS